MTDISEEYECSQCGRNGFPPDACDKCHGKANVVPRNYTLTEVRRGIAPKDPRRKDDGAVGPKIVKMPGS